MDANELLRLYDDKKGCQCTLTLEDETTLSGEFVTVMVKTSVDNSVLSADLVLNTEGQEWKFPNGFIKNIKFD